MTLKIYDGLVCTAIGALLVASAASAEPFASAPATLWLPDVVSTPQSEVRITFSPDGARMLWGTIGWSAGAGGWDIYESRRLKDGWSRPQSVTFNSDANDFDPSFAPDGSGVYFFSNRSGGFGKDDLYFAALNRTTGQYSAAVNLGAAINTAGDEWAPVVSPDGRQLMFASDGRGGKGKHDLYAARREGDRWVDARNLAELSSEEEDFDATFLHDGHSVILSRGDLEKSVVLYLARFRNGHWEEPMRLDETVNSNEPDAWTFGPSISAHDPGALYVTSQRAEKRGRADIYRIEYELTK